MTAIFTICTKLPSIPMTKLNLNHLKACNWKESQLPNSLGAESEFILLVFFFLFEVQYYGKKAHETHNLILTTVTHFKRFHTNFQASLANGKTDQNSDLKRRQNWFSAKKLHSL